MPLHDILTSLSALTIIVAFILGARPLRKILERKRMGGEEQSQLMSIRERLVIDRARRLTLVRCGAENFLLLTGGANDVMVPCRGEQDFSTRINAEELLS